MASITHVGMDVHKQTIAVAVLAPAEAKAVQWQIQNEPVAVRRLIRQLSQRAPVACVYEAGPTGYVLQRQLEAAQIPCLIAAPSLIPVRQGDRIKTDRRDACKLAELLRAGLLTAVHPPTEDHEAVRDLCRCREDAQQDLVRARHRLGKFLRRRGLIFRGGWPWSQRHRTWLNSLRFARDAERIVFEDYILVAELHDIRRFATAPDLMSYLGLVPSEYSSGGKRQRGGITRAGNSHVRRLLVETAWQYRHKPAVGVRLAKRRRGQPPQVIARADRAQQHLCKQYRKMAARGKHHNTIVVAIARLLVGYIWDTLRTAQPSAA